MKFLMPWSDYMDVQADPSLHCPHNYLTNFHVAPLIYYINNFLLLPSYWLCWGLTTRQPLWVILCRLPEKGRKEIEEIVEEMKERNREERGTGMKGKKQKK